MARKILITGSNGLLGQKLVKQLVQHPEFDLVATGRGENRISQAGDFTYEAMDITSRENVLEVFAKHQPEVVIHGAAMTNVDQCETDKEACYLQNVEATRFLIEASEKHNAHLIALSTDFIFDGEDGPYDEDAEANPISIYGESKLEAEVLVKKSTCPWAIVRTVLVFGIAEDMSRSNIILWVKGSLEQGKEIHVVNDQWRSPTLAEDLAAGCILIGEKGATGVYNICGKEVLTPYDMAIQTAEFFDLDLSLINETDGSRFKQTAKRPPKTGLLIDKAIADLGYAPTSFKEGLEILQSQLLTPSA